MATSCSPPSMRIASSSVQVEKRAKSDQTTKRQCRSQNWRENETGGLLLLRLQTMLPSEGSEKWAEVVSERLLSDYNVDRSPSSCRMRVDTLLKEFNAIHDHELKVLSGTSGYISFWSMTKDQKSKCENLPRTFLYGWYVLMERILKAKADKKNASKNVTKSASVAAASTQIVVPSQQHVEDEEPCMPDYQTYARVAPFIGQQIADAMKPFYSFLNNLDEREKVYQETMLVMSAEVLKLKRERSVTYAPPEEMSLVRDLAGSENITLEF